MSDLLSAVPIMTDFLQALDANIALTLLGLQFSLGDSWKFGTGNKFTFADVVTLATN